MGVMPPQLSDLSMLKQLLITKHFHVRYLVTVLGSARAGDLQFFTQAKLLAVSLHHYHTGHLPLAIGFQHVVFADFTAHIISVTGDSWYHDGMVPKGSCPLQRLSQDQLTTTIVAVYTQSQPDTCRAQT